MIKRRDREQGYAAKTGMDRTETTLTFNTEKPMEQIRLELVNDSASYSKPRGKTRQ